MAQRLRQILNYTILELPLISAVLLGVALRVYQITLQIPADDEWHALHALMTSRFVMLATHFGFADYCIPLTLAFRVSYLFYGLSESILRFPVLFFGIAFLLVGPWLVRSWIGKTTSTTFAWLLAVSPLLVFYSRYARPYIISAFFCFVAAFAFFAWWKGKGRPWKLVYATCAILGPYFHLSTLAFMAAPLSFGFVELLVSKRNQHRNWKEFFHLSVLVAGGLILLLGPPLLVDRTAWSGKLAQEGISVSTLFGSAELAVGTSNSWLVLVVLVLAFAGSVSLLFRKRRLLLYLMFLIMVQVGANLLVGPSGSQAPIVFVRYAMSCLPLMLLFVAVAVTLLEEWAGRLLPIPTGTSAVLLGVLLLLLGPLSQTYFYPNNWTNHGVFQYCYDTSDREFHYRYRTRPKFLSDFYAELGQQPAGTLKILEAPWYYEFHNNPFPYFQRVHRQEMLIGFVDPPKRWNRAGEYPPSYSRLRFHSFVHLSQHDEIAARNIAYIVLHKDLASEMPNSAGRKPVDMTCWISGYRSVYGAPHFEDSSIVVFKTDRSNIRRKSEEGSQKVTEFNSCKCPAA